MSEGGQTRKNKPSQEETEAQAPEEAEDTTSTDEEVDELLEDVDGLLDEIDDVLEENAEEFIKNYVQKGGQ